MRYFLISNNVDTQTGFRLVGIEGVVVHTAEEVREALDHALSTPDIGVILINEKLVPCAKTGYRISSCGCTRRCWWRSPTAMAPTARLIPSPNMCAKTIGIKI